MNVDVCESFVMQRGLLVTAAGLFRYNLSLCLLIYLLVIRGRVKLSSILIEGFL